MIPSSMCCILRSTSVATSAVRRSLRTEAAPLLAAAKKAGGGGKVGGGPASVGITKLKKMQEVETDTSRLVSHCCGLDYSVEGGKDPELGPDSDYPEWLFSMNVRRPKPTSDELEPGTMEHYLAMREEHAIRQRKIKKLKRELKLLVK